MRAGPNQPSFIPTWGGQLGQGCESHLLCRRPPPTPHLCKCFSFACAHTLGLPYGLRDGLLAAMQLASSHPTHTSGLPYGLRDGLLAAMWLASSHPRFLQVPP